MNVTDCDKWRERLPEMAAKLLDSEERVEVEAHLEACASCRTEYEVVSQVRAALPPVPEGLEARIQARVREEFAAGVTERGDRETAEVLPFRRRKWVPLWGLSAAAVVVLALGTSLLWNGQGRDVIQDPIVVASQEPAPEAWLWDDGMVAGAPVYDGLTDEDIEALLEEFEGGA